VKFKKILVYNIDRAKNLDPNSWKRIESFTSKIIFVPKDSPTLKQELADTDCVLVNFGTVVGKEEIDAAHNLKYIGVMATAFGKIDTVYAKKKKIIVSNLKDIAQNLLLNLSLPQF
jgi:glycerate dehydrogenase